MISISILHKFIQNIGVNDRTKKVITMDTSRIKIGRHSLHKRLRIPQRTEVEWRNGISKDPLRINLKRTFF